ncbi:MAG: LysR substrate-binding domain-containing protein [Parasphingopyxis sp.]
MRTLPPLSAIRVFEAAARHQNFTNAAEELGMTQAAVSYQIKLLEHWLEAPLFQRERGRVALLDTAIPLATQATAALDLLSDAVARMREADDSQLTISSYGTFSNRWLAMRLGNFQLNQANLAVRLDVNDGLVDFARGDVDVAIRVGRGGWPGLHSQFLMRVHYAPMASPEFIAAHGPLDTPQRIMASHLLSPDDRWWINWSAYHGITDTKPLPAVRLDSQMIEGSAAIAGQGIAILDPALWADELADGRLVQLGKAIYGRTSVWIVCPELQRNQPKIKMFRDWLIEEAETHPMHAIIRLDPDDPRREVDSGR